MLPLTETSSFLPGFTLYPYSWPKVSQIHLSLSLFPTFPLPQPLWAPGSMWLFLKENFEVISGLSAYMSQMSSYLAWGNLWDFPYRKQVQVFFVLRFSVIGRGEVQDTGPYIRDTHQPRRRRRRRKRRRGMEKEEELTFEDSLCIRHCSDHFSNINSFDSCINSKS